MQWLCYDLGEGEVAAVPYPWSQKAPALSDMQTLCAIARTSIYDMDSAVVVTADTEAEAVAEARDLRERRMAAARLKLPGTPTMPMLQDIEGGLLYDMFIAMIDEAMELHDGIQKDAAEHLGISPRSIGYHLKKPKLQHWLKNTK